MEFTIGNIITLLVVAVVLAVYRQLDKNNRSLEKIKRYSEKIKDELDAYVDSKTIEVKNFAIELDVHQETGKAILNRISKAEEHLETKAAYIEKMYERVNEYDKALNELTQMTGRVQDNLNRLHEESEFVDKVGKRVKEAGLGILKLEKEIPGLKHEFAKENIKELKIVRTVVLKDTQKVVSHIKNELDSSEKKVKDFGSIVEELERTRKVMKNETVESIQKFLDEQVYKSEQTSEQLTADLIDRFDVILTRKSEEAEVIEADMKKSFEKNSEYFVSTIYEAEEKVSLFKDQIRIVEAAYMKSLKSAAEKGKTLEDEAFDSIRQKITLDIEDLKSGVDQSLGNFNSDVSAKILELDTSYAEISENNNEALDGIRKKITLEIEDLKSGVDQSFGNLNSAASAKVLEFETSYEEMSESNNKALDGIRQKLTSDIEGLKSEYKQSLGVMNSTVSAKVSGFKNSYEEISENNNKTLNGIRQKITSDIENLKTDYEQNLSKTDSSISAKMSDFGTAYVEISDKNKEALEKLSEELLSSDKSVRDRVSVVESRVHEFEDTISYKFTKIESISSDLDSLDKNLRISMEQTVNNIETDFLDYAKQQDQAQIDYKQKISEEMNELDSSLNSLELELNGLKTRAYENVAKGLKVFEDDFFSNLKNRNVEMEEKLIEWQGSIDKNLEDLGRSGEENRLIIEKSYSEKLKDRFEELQERVFANQVKFESQVSDFQLRIEDRMSHSDSSMDSIEESIKKNLSEIEERANISFSREFVEFNTGVSSKLKKSERDIDVNLKNIVQVVDQKGKELLGIVENSQSDVTVWQAKILQEMKEAEDEMTSGYGDLKKNIFNNISQIKSDFESQKEDLILNTQEERARIKNELKENAAGIIQLETDLRGKAESSIENFNREYDVFNLEIQKKNRDMQVEFDKKIKDFRLISGETKEKTDQLQKKLYGKIEENYKILAVNLQEIDKRQKGFINQTKIFDRADSLKVSLQEAIEDLKSELVKVEVQSNEAREAERKFGSIKKLGDEVNAKLSRFLAEKRRIEEMEGDFKKLIIISQSVDNKLRQVTNSHDDLQAIQIKIRNLEELEKEISVKFERLEKKDQIIENTTVNVDKNFQQLSDLDDKIRSLSEDVTNIPEKIHDLTVKIELLSRNKKKADETAKQVEALDGLLKDIEERIENMQKAREWLAKTETRLEEVSKQAQEQVKLLGTILKDGNKSGSGGKGAPSMGARDVVTRLAHQGWSIQEIASTTKLSRGEVELILELLPKK